MRKLALALRIELAESERHFESPSFAVRFLVMPGASSRHETLEAAAVCKLGRSKLVLANKTTTGQRRTGSTLAECP